MTTQTILPDTAAADAAELDAAPTYEVEHSPAGHFQLRLSRLIGRMVENLYQALPSEQLTRLVEEYPFVDSYRQQLSGLPFARWLATFEARYAGHLPLHALQERLAITDSALDLLLAAGLIEEDIRFGALFAALQDPLASREPCLGILNWLLAPEDGPSRDAVPLWQAAEDLARQGLLTIQRGQGAVRLEWTLRVPLPIWDALSGRRLAQPAGKLALQPAADFPNLADLILPALLREQISHLPAMIAAGQIDTLVLRGMTGSGRRTVLGAVARALGRDLLVHGVEGLTPEGHEEDGDSGRRLLGPLATLTNSLPVIRLAAGAGEMVRADSLPGYSGTVGIAMSRIGGLEGSAMDNALTLAMVSPAEAQRAMFWGASALPLDADGAAIVANRFLLTGGRILRAAPLARNRMLLDGRTQAEPEDVRVAMRAVNRQVLETLASPLPAVAGWSSLVVAPRVAELLELLEARCRSREQILAHVGPAFANSLNRGVRALFSGPSGTGKTLAARALAGSLQMDLYRVDLASVVNKYIGETEKNLNRIFTYAEELDIILLLDEGDSLMTRRTDVKGANDRYANLETNFLLQRLESYEGIILITTNAAQRIDQAFVRRLDATVDFGLPEAEERRLLWRLHLPEDHQIDDTFLEKAVLRCKLSGGQIRNTALHAGLLALRRGGPITAAEFADALQREYRKAGHPYPLASGATATAGRP
jgi:hypothetical protein